MNKGREGEPIAQEAWGRMAEFIQSGTQSGFVANYILEGPTDDVPIQFTHLAGFFPKNYQQAEAGYAIAGQSSRDPMEINRKILSLQVPERHQDSPVKDNIIEANRFDFSLAMVGLPSIVLGFGQHVLPGEEVSEDPKEEVIVLFATSMRSPQRALEMLQHRVQSRMNKLS